MTKKKKSSALNIKDLGKNSQLKKANTNKIQPLKDIPETPQHNSSNKKQNKKTSSHTQNLPSGHININKKSQQVRDFNNDQDDDGLNKTVIKQNEYDDECNSYQLNSSQDSIDDIDNNSVLNNDTNFKFNKVKKNKSDSNNKFQMSKNAVQT